MYQQGDDGRVCDLGEVLQALDEALQSWRHCQVLQRLAGYRVAQNTLREGVQQRCGNLCDLLHLSTHTSLISKGASILMMVYPDYVCTVSSQSRMCLNSAGFSCVSLRKVKHMTAL